MRRQPLRVVAVLKELFADKCGEYLTYAPWRGPFGIHYTTTTGRGFRWWGYNPITWIKVWVTETRKPNTKAAFMYVRNGRYRAAAILTYYLKAQPPGA